MIKIENKYTNEDLKIMQKWDLERKIRVTQTRLLEWYQQNNNKCYVSFSGGKDSTVLADLTAGICKGLDCKLVLWFSDTGLEYPELKKHVKIFGKFLEDKWNIDVETIIDYPKDKEGKRIVFKDVILEHGYPVISKEIAKRVVEYRNAEKKNNLENSLAYQEFNGLRKGNTTSGLSHYNKEKWKFLLDAPFKISNKCCDVMKKKPAKQFEKITNLKPIVGTMADESQVRKKVWLENGCNSFNSVRPMSTPISFWTEQDIFKYIKDLNIPIPTVYGDILQDEKGKYYTTGESRTGCVWCIFGIMNDKERFIRLKKNEPKLWEYCIKPLEEGGLNIKEVLNYIDIKSE